MITVSQDVFVPIADLLGASTVKIVSGVIGGPVGIETIGSAVDVVTSIANGVYDGERYFGILNPHYSLGIQMSQGKLGKIFLIYYP